MGIIMRFLKPLMDNLADREELKKLHRERKNLDRRIDSLERLTLDGENDWFLKVVKRDPECAIKIIKECSNERTP